MNNNIILSENNIYEIYSTKNIFIRWLANRFLKKIKNILKATDSLSTIGLDVGCGQGHMLSYLHTKGVIRDIIAIDMDEERLNFANKQYPVCKYMLADIHKLNFKTNTFDFVIATEILEHLPDPITALKEIKRVAKDNANILISIPYEPFFHWGNLIRGKHLKRWGKTPHHLNFWNRMEFKTIMKEFITIEQEFYISTFPWLLFFGKNKK